ncbi:hypothetical protein SDC9_153494 [bioreactor metagenome]|uniref:Uncharacterized protein n=1 Tax=bioreactor metagenome TaxID=1076179 RepID=A0A645EW22_9ZZZZ
MLAQKQPAHHRHARRNGGHDHPRRGGAGQAHARDHADGEQEVAEKRLQKQQPARLAAHGRLAGQLAQPVRHGQHANAKAQPGQQKDGKRGRQRLGQRDVTAHQHHAQRKACVGDGAADHGGGAAYDG